MAKERVLTFGTAQQLGIRLPNMSASGGTQTVEIIPYEAGGDFSFGSTQNNFKNYNFVQLIPYVKYTWSGYYVLENTKGINGDAKGTYNIPITIKAVRTV